MTSPEIDSIQEITTEQRIARRIWMQENLLALINEISYHRQHKLHFESGNFVAIWPGGEIKVL